MQHKADFDYSLDNLHGHKFIVIIDKALGNKSVKEDIDNVIENITINDTRIDDPENNYRVIFMDENGSWWSYNLHTEEFTNLDTKDTNKEAMTMDLTLDGFEPDKASCETCKVPIVRADRFVIDQSSL